MGMKLFSSGRSEAGTPAPGDPIPTRFKIVSTELCHGFTIATISYPDCTTFDGIKVMVYWGDVRATLAAATQIDPHFTSATTSPLARFQPTPEGLMAARGMCRSLSTLPPGPNEPPHPGHRRQVA